MNKTLPFNDPISEYEAWFKKYLCVFKSEVAAINQLLPKGENEKGIEIGVVREDLQGYYALKKALNQPKK